MRWGTNSYHGPTKRHEHSRREEERKIGGITQRVWGKEGKEISHCPPSMEPAIDFSDQLPTMALLPPLFGMPPT